MKCEDLQLSLGLYPDGTLLPEEQAVVDEHLVACPLCRQKLDDLRTLRAGLKQFSRPVIPADLAGSVKVAVRSEIIRSKQSAFGFVSEGFREFLQMRVMPFAVGTAASLVIGFSLLWILLSNTSAPIGDLATRQELTAPVFLPKPGPTASLSDIITPSGLAAERLSVSWESPSINPQGALVALTKSMAGRMKDDEVVVVADVFSDGLASVEEIVAPLDDARTLFELERALEKDSSDAPFVPAFMDNRADSVRVVLKIQRVNIKANGKPKRR